MDKNSLKNLLFTHDKSRLKANAWNMQKATELINILDSSIDLESYALKVISCGFFDLKELVRCLDCILQERAKDEALQYKIKNFVGTSYQEQILKERFCYVKSCESLPKWYKELL